MCNYIEKKSVSFVKMIKVERINNVKILKIGHPKKSEPPHDKTNKMTVRPAKTRISLVPADKAANNVVVVWRLHYINTLKQELSGTKASKRLLKKRSL